MPTDEQLKQFAFGVEDMELIRRSVGLAILSAADMLMTMDPDEDDPEIGAGLINVLLKLKNLQERI